VIRINIGKPGSFAQVQLAAKPDKNGKDLFDLPKEQARPIKQLQELFLPRNAKSRDRAKFNNLDHSLNLKCKQILDELKRICKQYGTNFDNQILIDEVQTLKDKLAKEVLADLFPRTKFSSLTAENKQVILREFVHRMNLFAGLIQPELGSNKELKKIAFLILMDLNQRYTQNLVDFYQGSQLERTEDFCKLSGYTVNPAVNYFIKDRAGADPVDKFFIPCDVYQMDWNDPGFKVVKDIFHVIDSNVSRFLSNFAVIDLNNAAIGYANPYLHVVNLNPEVLHNFVSNIYSPDAPELALVSQATLAHETVHRIVNRKFGDLSKVNQGKTFPIIIAGQEFKFKLKDVSEFLALTTSLLMTPKETINLLLRYQPYNRQEPPESYKFFLGVLRNVVLIKSDFVTSDERMRILLTANSKDIQNIMFKAAQAVLKAIETEFNKPKT